MLESFMNLDFFVKKQTYIKLKRLLQILAFILFIFIALGFIIWQDKQAQTFVKNKCKSIYTKTLQIIKVLPPDYIKIKVTNKTIIKIKNVDTQFFKIAEQNTSENSESKNNSIKYLKLSQIYKFTSYKIVPHYNKQLLSSPFGDFKPKNINLPTKAIKISFNNKNIDAIVPGVNTDFSNNLLKNLNIKLWIFHDNNLIIYTDSAIYTYKNGSLFKNFKQKNQYIQSLIKLDKYDDSTLISKYKEDQNTYYWIIKKHNSQANSTDKDIVMLIITPTDLKSTSKVFNSCKNSKSPNFVDCLNLVKWGFKPGFILPQQKDKQNINISVPCSGMSDEQAKELLNKYDLQITYRFVDEMFAPIITGLYKSKVY